MLPLNASSSHSEVVAKLRLHNRFTVAKLVIREAEKVMLYSHSSVIDGQQERPVIPHWIQRPSVLLNK